MCLLCTTTVVLKLWMALRGFVVNISSNYLPVDDDVEAVALVPWGKYSLPGFVVLLRAVP